MAGRRAYILYYNIVYRYVRRRYNSITLITYYIRRRVSGGDNDEMCELGVFYIIIIIIIIIITTYTRAREKE